MNETIPPNHPDRRAAAASSLRRENALLVGQKRVLEMVAKAAPLADTLTELTRFIEAQENGMRCGIHVTTGDGGRFRRGVGPALPEAYHRALEGVPVAPPYRAPCGEAAHRDAVVAVPDIAADTRYSDEWRDSVLSSGLASCRSTPIRGSDGRVIATFAFYYDHPRDPDPTHPQLVEIATHLAGIALERQRSEQALRESEARQAAELTVARRLQELSIHLIQEGDVDALYDQIINAAIVLTHSDAASMQMLDYGVGGLRLLAWRGFDPESAAVWEWVGADSTSICGAALASGKRVMVPDVETCDFMAGTADLDACRRSGIRAAQSTPLISRSGALLGMLSTHWREPHRVSDGDLRLLDVLARQAADLIERTEAEAALRRSEARLRQIVDSATEYAIITLDRERRITSWNGGAERLLGYEESEVVGRSGDIFFCPEDRAAEEPERETRTAREQGRAANERWHMCRDGSRFWGSGVMLPVEGDETNAYLKIFRDRTEERQAEERRGVLINELNHRVKNTLATVQSIASQTLRSGKVDAAVRESFESRLIALANAHDLLTRENWEGAELREITHTAVGLFRARERDQFHIEGPIVHLTPKAALALAMGLHELATNAMKYGALSSETGRVGITWAVDESEPPRLRFRWEERGGPAVAAPPRKGFGSRLIERGLAGELGGAVRLDYAPAGVVCTIDVPLSNLRRGSMPSGDNS